MDYYNILGVKENATREEIQAAYDKQVKKYKEEIKDEKRAKLFLKAFDEAYEALIKLSESGQQQQPFNLEAFEQRNKAINVEESIQPKTTISVEAKQSSSVTYAKESGQVQEVERRINRGETVVIKPQEIQQEYEIQRRDSSRNGASSNKSKRRSNASSKIKSNGKKNSSSEKKNQDIKNEKNKKQRVVKEKTKSTTSTVMNILMVPLKILALPIIAILSVITFICTLLNVASWIASKVIIIGAIGIGAIHLYEVHKGQQLMNNKILIVLMASIIASYFLPHILRFTLKVFGSLNNVLKNFVF